MQTKEFAGTANSANMLVLVATSQSHLWLSSGPIIPRDTIAGSDHQISLHVANPSLARSQRMR